MKKSLVALAALAATGAFAQSTVTLSGRASMDVSTYEASGATPTATATSTQLDHKRRTRIADTASRITFAATEDLGRGLRAGVYCETGINIDNASNMGQAGSNNANTSEFCSREGRLFIGNNTGEIRLGRQNVWWTQGALNAAGSTYIGSDTLTNLINGGVGVYGVRLENMVMLQGGAALGAFAGSQVFYGVMGIGGGNPTAPGASGVTPTVVSTGEAVNSTATSGQNGGSPKGTYNGFKLNYSAGALVGMIDYQKSTASASGVAANGSAYNSFDRNSTKYGLGYKYKGASNSSIVSAQYWTKERTDRTNAGATFSMTSAAAGNGKDTGYGVTLHHDLGGGLMAHAQWGKTNNVKGTTAGEIAGSGATAYTLGGTYALSRRTHLYGAYHSIKNGTAANYNMSGGNYASATSNLGADVKVLALGAIHNF